MFLHYISTSTNTYIQRFEHLKFVHATFFLPLNHPSCLSSTSFFLHFLNLSSFCTPLPALSPFFSPLPFPRCVSPSLLCFCTTLHVSPSLFHPLPLSLRTSKGCVSTKAQLNSGVVDLGRSLTTQEKGRERDRQRKKRKKERRITNVLEY